VRANQTPNIKRLSCVSPLLEFDGTFHFRTSFGKDFFKTISGIHSVITVVVVSLMAGIVVQSIVSVLHLLLGV